jgi:ferredoxin
MMPLFKDKMNWRFIRAGGWKHLITLKHVPLFIYGRWTKHYIGYQKKRVFPRMKEGRKKRWADKTHYKVLTPDHARSIITLEDNISIRANEQVIPYATARDIVLNGPPDIAVYECGCRQSSPNPCEPIQVCLVVGQPFVDFVLKYHPKTSRRITQDEALKLIEAEHKRGHIQTAWFKDVCFSRFYAICNCCTCCCIGIQAMTKYHIPMAASSGFISQVDNTICSGCGECEKICPFSAIKVDDVAEVDRETCLGCGVCVEKCPEAALQLIRDKAKGEPLDVQKLASQ